MPAPPPPPLRQRWGGGATRGPVRAGEGDRRGLLIWLEDHVGTVVVVAAFLFGVGAIRAAYDIAERSTGTGYFALFWLGYLVVLGATVVPGLRFSTSDRARTALLLGFGVVTFLPKTFMSMSGPAYFDEFGHIRQVNEIIARGTLDVSNSFLPIIKYYPGLAMVTAGVHYLTGLDTWTAGQVVIGVAHVGVLLAVWRLAKALGVRPHYAYLAAILFSLNPSYLYFDTEYAYESLGLPLAVVAVTCLVLARSSTTSRRAAGWSAAAGLVGTAVVFTHHVSAGFAAAMMFLVALVLPVGRRGFRPRMASVGPWVAALGTALALVLWVTTIARSTIGYIQPHVQSALSEAVDVVLRKHQTVKTSAGSTKVASHQLFSGSGVPAYEILCAYLAPLVALAAVLAALLQAWWQRRETLLLRRRLPFLLLGAGYLASLPIDVTATGGETAHRMWAYTYVGVAVCAVSADQVWRRVAARFRLRSFVVSSVALVALSVVAIGNVAAGEDTYYRFPGPYVFGTDTRSRTPELYQLARWANTHIAPGTRVVTDRFTGEVIEADTGLDIPAPNQSTVFWLYLEGGSATPGLVKYLHEQDFQYWIIDLRIGTEIPKQKLFETYVGPISVDRQSIVDASRTPLFSPVYRSPHYEILRIN